MFNIDWPLVLLRLPWVLLALSIHEYAHAQVSHKSGDPTPEWEQRLSLNPLAHLDWLGFLSFVLVGFGWAKPVMVNPSYYRNPVKGLLRVALAGPFSNFIMAFFIASAIWVIQLLGLTSRVDALIGAPNASGITVIGFLGIGVWINLVLGFFNLIPIPPLDGSKVLRYFLRGSWGRIYDRFEPYGTFLLLILVFTGLISWFFMPLSYLASVLLSGYWFR